jgi:hypothetical protein
METPQARVVESLEARLQEVFRRSSSTQESRPQPLTLQDLESSSIQPFSKLRELEQLYQRKVELLTTRVAELERENGRLLAAQQEEKSRTAEEVRYLRERNRQLEGKLAEKEDSLRDASGRVEFLGSLEESLRHTERNYRNLEVRAIELE